jgi:methylmalonyl-CoA mutase N-terminal domain/subunit
MYAMDVKTKTQTPSNVAHIESLEIKLSRTKTNSGLETKAFYGPNDVKIDYERDLGDPGCYPYTRGSYPEMYRSRMWTLRNIVGYGAPEDTRDGVEKTLAAGGKGIDVVVDSLTQHATDPDHPAFAEEVGLEGCSLPTVRDVERLIHGIDPTKVDVAWHWAILSYPMAAAAAIRGGYALDKLQGSNMPDNIRLNISGWGDMMPPVMGHRVLVDLLEYCCEKSPRWTPGFPQGYDYREAGATAPTELAVGLSVVKKTFEDVIARGNLNIDQLAPRVAWVSNSDIDFFEEIAKFRAIRRMWAHMMKDHFGAKDPKSMRVRIACHTSGRSLIYKQPLNNLARAAIESVAALLGGVQSLEACSYDEPVCVPTQEARELATRMQQIIANEVGAARTADPLGGSYYIEALTNEVEAAARSIMDTIDGMGGIVEAVKSGYIEGLSDQYNLDLQRELDNKERIIIGVNDFVPADDPPTRRFTFDRKNIEIHVRRFTEMKGQRDQVTLNARIRDVYSAMRSGQNATQAMIDALLVDATIGEVWGTARVASGHSYDLFRVLESPFDYSGL